MGNTKKVNNSVNENKETKIVTKYDKKVQKRLEEQRKEARSRLITRISMSVIAAVLCIAAVITLWIKFDSINNEYIRIGDDKINEVEYDYYYNMSVNNFVSSYSYYLSTMGIDTSKDFSNEEYMDGLTWGDYFDEMTVEQLKQTKALAKHAKENNFEFDVTEDYNNFVNELSEQASSTKMSVKKYYKESFGKYATEKKMKPYVEEYLMVAAYYEKLTENLAATDSEVMAKYNEDKNAYDYFDYRLLAIAVEGTTTEAVKAAEEKADNMLKGVSDEQSFIELCKEYAAQDQKSAYEDDTKSLNSQVRYSDVALPISEWFSDASRKAGDKAVIEDTDNNQYYVIYFLNRYFDDEVKTEISDSLLSTTMQEYMEKLTENIEIKDKYHYLKYLKVKNKENE